MLGGVRDLLCNKPGIGSDCATLSGSIPNIPMLKTLIVIGENLEGTLPSKFGKHARSLIMISGASTDWINPRTISGTLPTAWNSEHGKLLLVIMMNVKVSGSIPIMLNQPELQSVNLVKEALMMDAKQASGIPDWFRRPTIIGNLPPFSASRNPALQELAIIGHSISGTLIWWHKLTAWSTGTLPQTIFEITSLHSIKCTAGRISGRSEPALE